MIDKFDNFENLFEGLKSEIVKRLQKEPYTRNRYKDGNYIEETTYRETSGFQSLRHNYNLEKLDDSYFQQISQEQARKKPFNTDYQVYCFYKGKYQGNYIGIDVYAEGGRRRGEPVLTRKALIDMSDEFWAFDFERARREIYRHDIQRKRSEIKSDTELMYKNVNSWDKNDPKELMHQSIKKQNLERYYKAKSKNINFDEIFDLMQERLKRAYKELAFNVEDCKSNPKKNYYYLTIKSDAVLLEIASMDYNTPNEKSEFFSCFNNALKSIQKYHQKFMKIKDNKEEYSHDSKETVEKLQRILGLLKGEIQLKEKK